MIKKITVIILLFLLFTLNATADETDLYKDQLEAGGVNGLTEAVPEKAEEFLNEFSIDLNDSDWVDSLTGENAFLHILKFIKGGARAPLKAFGIILALIFLNAAIQSALSSDIQNTVNYIMVLAVSFALLSPIYSVITASVDTLKGCSYFMTAFVPVFAAILGAAGKPLTSASMSGVLLMAANTVTYIANFAVIPLMSGHLSLSVASSVSPLLKDTNLAESLKKLSFWIMGFISTVFIGILSIQTAVNASADSLSLKTAKFIVGSTVPVAGGVLSEALATVTASLSLLKSSVGIWGVLVCALTFLPLIIELLLWRICMWGLSFFSSAFSISKITNLFKSVDSVLSSLVGIVLLTAAMFIISLTVVIIGGKSV